MQVTFNSAYSLSNIMDEAIAHKTDNPGYGATVKFAEAYMIETARTQAIAALVEVVDQTNEQSCRTGKLEQEATIAVSDFVRKMTGQEDENAPLTVEEIKSLRSTINTDDNETTLSEYLVESLIPIMDEAIAHKIDDNETTDTE